MKILRFFSLFFIILLIFPIIYFSFFFDSENFKNSIVENISNKINEDIRFDNQIDLTFFPNPKIVLYNLSFSDKKKTVNVYNTEITSKWESLLRGSLEFKKIKFLNPNISLNFKKFKQTRTFEHYFVHVNSNNYSKNIDSHLSLFKEIEVEDGILKILTNSGEKNLEKINLLFTNANRQIDGNFFFKNLNSNFFLKAKSQSDNYEAIDVSIEQKIQNHKEKIFLNGIITNQDQIFEFNGLLKSKSLNISKLMQLTTKKKPERVLLSKKVKNTFPDFFKVKINANIEKLNIYNQTFYNVTFNSFINNNLMKIEQFKCNYLGGILNFNADYNKGNSRLKGMVFFQKFSLPTNPFRKKQYYLGGGENNLSSSFESFFEENNFQSLIKNLNLIGKLEIKNVDLYGLDLDEFSKKIDNFSGINDFFEILKLSKNGNESKVDSIKSDFRINNNKLKFDNLTSRSSNITVYSSGIYFLNTKKLNVSNKIKIRLKKFPNFPSFNVKVQGLVGELDYIYDLKNLKEYLISRSLKKLLKKNNEKLEEFEDFLDFFTD